VEGRVNPKRITTNNFFLVASLLHSSTDTFTLYDILKPRTLTRISRRPC